MSSDPGDESKRSDWSRVDARLKSRGSRANPEPERAQTVEPAAAVPAQLAVPEAVAISTPVTDAPKGILMRLRQNKIDREAAMEALKAQRDSQLEALRYQLRQAVTVSNARADRIAEEYLKKLDSEHIQVLKDLGLRNAETRADALIQVREMIAGKLREVQNKNWPQVFIDQTIDDLIDLQKRVRDELMKELGAE